MVDTLDARAEQGDLSGLPVACGRPVMVDMQVIVRRQDSESLRLDHLHNQALCGPKGELSALPS